MTFRCSKCQAANQVNPDTAHIDITCAECTHTTPLTFSDSALHKNQVDACPLCGKRDFYVQRDFNQRVGVGIVVIFALIGLVFVWFDRPVYFYVSLGAAALIDLVLYGFLPELTVCYACKSAFRNVNTNPEHKPFDLHIADVYDNRSKG